jgi:hypothetical protein
MSKLEMQQCVLGQVFTNCYFLRDRRTADRRPGRLCRKSFSESISYAGKTGGDPSDTWSF